ncbi:MAG: ABC transporter substrate-binding protein [Lachnospiraceae bacterium]|jgi:simple sugar transport system substrate-binding protein
MRKKNRTFKMARKMITAITVSILVSSLFMSGCGMPFSADVMDQADEEDKTNESAGEADQNLITVGFSQLGSESGWRTANTESIQNTLTADNGFFLLFENARQQQENQIKSIRSFISQRVDCISFAPVVEDGWDTVLEEAKQAGIPVVVADRSISVKDDSLYATFVGEDMNFEGTRAGEWLSDYLESSGRQDEDINIVVLQGTSGSSAQLGRTMGFDAIADKHSNWSILAQENAEFTTALGEEVMNGFLSKYKDIDVVVAQNDDMMLGALEAIHKAGFTTGENGDMIVISYDATRAGLQKLLDGEINVDVECNPLTGPLLADVIRKIVAGETVDKVYFLDESVYTAENAGDVIDSRAY